MEPLDRVSIRIGLPAPNSRYWGPGKPEWATESVVPRPSADETRPPLGCGVASRTAALVAYAAQIAGVGAGLALLGPAMPLLTEQTGLSLSSLSFLITARGFGYLAASPVGRLFDSPRVQGNLLLGAVVTTAGIGCIALPHVNALWGLLVIASLVGAAMSVADTGSNVLTLAYSTVVVRRADGEETTTVVPRKGRRVRRQRRRRASRRGPAGEVGGDDVDSTVYRFTFEPPIHALHLAFAVGAFLSPLMLGLLVEHTTDRTAMVVAFSVVGALLIATGGGALALYYAPPLGPVDVASVDPASPDDKGVSTSHHGMARSSWRSRAALCGTAAGLCTYVGCEAIMSSFISSYSLLVQDSFAVADGAYLSTAFFAALVAGRATAMVVSARLPVARMLAASCLLSLVGVLLLLATQAGGPGVLYLSVVLIGYGFGPVFPAALVFLQTRRDIRGHDTSILVFFAAAGEMAFPVTVGRLLGTVGPEPFTLILAAVTVVFSLCFVFVGFISHR
jgi:MFS family permease